MKVISRPPQQTKPATGHAAEAPAAGVRPAENGLVLAGIFLLVFGVAIDRFGIPVQGFNLRIELIVGALLAVAFVMRAGVKGTLRLIRAMGVVEYCLVAWVLLSFASTILFSPTRGESLKLTLLVSGFLVLYLVAFMLLRSQRAVISAALAWVGIGTVVAFMGLVDSLLYVAFRWVNGITLELTYQDGRFLLTPKVYSTLWEPNLFGTYCLTVGVLALGLSCAPEFRVAGWTRWLRLAALIAFCGEMLSMTRTLWVVTPVVLLLFSVLLLWRRVVGWRELITQLVGPAAIGVLVGFAIGYLMPGYSMQSDAPPTLQQQHQVITQATSPNSSSGGQDVVGGSALGERVTSLSNLGGISSLVGRQREFTLAFQGWLQKPLFGWGTGSFAAYDVGGDKWIGNLELHILFDTGGVGLLLWIVAVAVPVWRVIRRLRRPLASWTTTEYLLLGLLTGGVGLVLAYQTTEGLWLGYTWVYLAIFVAASRALSPVNPTPKRGGDTRLAAVIPN